VLNGYPLNGAALNGVAAQPSGSVTLTAVLAIVTLVAVPAPVLAPIVSAPLAPPAAAPSTPLLPTTQYVAPAALPGVPAPPILSAAVIPAPLAILGSTVFIDLADPLGVVAAPITSAPPAPPVAPPAPLRPLAQFIAPGPTLAQPQPPIAVAAGPASVPLTPTLQFIRLAPPPGAPPGLPVISAPLGPPAGPVVALTKQPTRVLVAPFATTVAVAPASLPTTVQLLD